MGGQSGQSFGHLVELKIEGRCSNRIKIELKSQLFYIVRIKVGPGEKYYFIFQVYLTGHTSKLHYILVIMFII